MLVARLGSEHSVCLLADTAYGSCCADEVTAEHGGCQVIVQFGHTCLSKPARLPVFRVLCTQPIELDPLVEYFSGVLQTYPIQNVLLVSQGEYDHHLKSIKQKLGEQVLAPHLEKFIDPRGWAVPNPGSRLYAHELDEEWDRIPQTSCVYNSDLIFGRLVIHGEGMNIRDGSFAIFYIGDQSPLLTRILMEYRNMTIFSYNPKTLRGYQETQANRSLMKRYAIIEKAQRAKAVGILVGTLGIDKYVEVINQCKKLIKHAGKRSYVISMGKINVPKLANFPHIDLFVLVACPENPLLENREITKPMITPYELGFLLVDNTGALLEKWTNNFDVFLQEIHQWDQIFSRRDETRQNIHNGSALIEYESIEQTAERLHSGAYQGYVPQSDWVMAQGRQGTARGYEKEGLFDWRVESSQ